MDNCFYGGAPFTLYQRHYAAQDGSAPVETQVNINTTNLLDDPTITALAKGGWVVTWSQIQGGSKNIYQRVYTSNGVASQETVVNETLAGTQNDSSVTALEDGSWVVTWSSVNNNSTVDVFQRLFAADGSSSGEVRVSTTSTDEAPRSFVTALKGGGWIVAWVSGTDVHQQRYAVSQGNVVKVQAETLVNTTTAGVQSQPSVTPLEDGGWVVTWTSPDGSGTGIYQQRFTKDGERMLSPTTPKDVLLAAQIVSEGAASGAPAGSLSTVAIDVSQGFTYTLLDDADGRFALSANGTLTVKDGIRLDYEQASSHAIKVRVQDKATLATFDKWVQVQVANVSSENLTGSAAADVLKGGAFRDIFKGSGGNDALYGGAGNDWLYGGTGNDRLSGGLGNDQLKGEAGRDVFVFDTRTNKRTNVDKVLDFKSSDDSFQLDNAIFTKLGSGTAARPKMFKSDMFVEGTRAKDREDRIVYDKKTGALYYDQDGTGSKAQVKIATINNKTKLYYNDFYVI